MVKYLSPLVPQRADPFLYKHTDGKYYFTATCPKYDRIEIKPDYYGQALEDDGMEGLYEFGMFSRSYIFDIGVRATRRMSGDGAIRADNAIQRYKARIPAGIETRDMMRIPELGLAALELFPEEKRRQVAILAAEIFRDLALEENG